MAIVTGKALRRTLTSVFDWEPSGLKILLSNETGSGGSLSITDIVTIPLPESSQNTNTDSEASNTYNPGLITIPVGKTVNSIRIVNWASRPPDGAIDDSTLFKAVITGGNFPYGGKIDLQSIVITQKRV